MGRVEIRLSINKPIKKNFWSEKLQVKSTFLFTISSTPDPINMIYKEPGMIPKKVVTV